MASSTSRRIFVLCPDDPAPSGGARKLYRHVDILNAQGYSAAILHSTLGVRLTWFPNDTPVVYRGTAVRTGDILAVPETYGAEIADIAGATPKVIINQNCYYTFRNYPPDVIDGRTPYSDPRVVATIAVSDDSREYLQYAFPNVKVLRIRYSIDPSLYAAPPVSGKKKQIAYMPRKNRLELQQVLRILLHRGALNGWNLAAIDNRSESDAAAVLRDSQVFLSFGYPEGFGLPPAEAMACGCVTIGYQGGGGREFFTPEHGFPIEAADIQTFVRTTEAVLAKLSAEPRAFDEMTARAGEFIRSTYSPDVERRDILDCWKKILERTA